MSDEILIKRALTRQKAFKNLKKNLKKIKKIVVNIDPDAEVFLFGSVAGGRYNYSSDIDILIVTKMEPKIIHAELWKRGIKEPFEIHIQPREKAYLYWMNAKLIRI
ncbi:MAG: nucleotidyltransferase domain-containing protein [Candidatus Bathyarchaeia archaeon]